MSRKKKKSSRRAKSKKAYQLKLKPQTVYSIAQITFFALSFLVIVSFARQGLILVRINDFLVTYFGWATIFLPFIFLTFGFLVSKFRGPLSQANVLIGSILFTISSASLTQSGIIGNSIWLGLSSLVTPIGSGIILVGSSFMGIIILFNSSLEQAFGLFISIAKYMKRFIRGEKLNVRDTNKKMMGEMNNKPLKIGGMDISDRNKKEFIVRGNQKQNPPQVKPQLEPKLVTNLPGEDKLWKYPPMSILSESQSGKADRGDIKGNAAIIEQTLESFGITARVTEVNMGPAVTQYGLDVALGTKLSKILSLERDLARALAAPGGSIRIDAPIPGRDLVGIELPNRSPEFVPFKKIIHSELMAAQTNKLAVALGLDVAGEPVVGNLGKMPHVLIAGQTGAGKSVAINTFLASLLFRASPSEVKLILVDPKRVELTGYNDIPHLLTPVIVQPDKVVSALRWVISEMDRRYKLFSEAGVRNLEGYNELSGFQALPYIVVVIDELADIMLFAPAEVEDSITKIAQMSRATGIHMVLATQRPSVDVITGLIKANIPTRIAFAVASQIDSRVILDGKGAEKLLGKGDMLYLAPDQAKPMRIQGAYVSDKEINELVAFLKGQGIAPHYTEEVTTMSKSGTVNVSGVEGDTDDLFRQAVDVVCQYDKASASLLQRRLSIGYARAARIIDQLEAAGVVGPQPDGSKPREVLIQSSEQFFGGGQSGDNQ